MIKTTQRRKVLASDVACRGVGLTYTAVQKSTTRGIRRAMPRQLDSWSDGLERAAWRPPRPVAQCRQFQEEAKDAFVSECTWTLSALQAIGPATENARRPSVLRRCRGTMRWWRLEDRSRRRPATSDVGWQQFMRYWGALPWRHRWTVTPSLWKIRCGTSSQCSVFGGRAVFATGWQCLWRAGGRCGSVTTITRNCVHRSSPNWVSRCRSWPSPAD